MKQMSWIAVLLFVSGCVGDKITKLSFIGNDVLFGIASDSNFKTLAADKNGVYFSESLDEGSIKYYDKASVRSIDISDLDKSIHKSEIKEMVSVSEEAILVSIKYEIKDTTSNEMVPHTAIRQLSFAKPVINGAASIEGIASLGIVGDYWIAITTDQIDSFASANRLGSDSGSIIASKNVVGGSAKITAADKSGIYITDKNFNIFKHDSLNEDIDISNIDNAIVRFNQLSNEPIRITSKSAIYNDELLIPTDKGLYLADMNDQSKNNGLVPKLFNKEIKYVVADDKGGVFIITSNSFAIYFGDRIYEISEQKNLDALTKKQAYGPTPMFYGSLPNTFDPTKLSMAAFGGDTWYLAADGIGVFAIKIETVSR